MSGEYIKDDGGRAAAGFRGRSGDCGVRALAIALSIPYKDARKLAKEFALKGRQRSRAISDGLYAEDFASIMHYLGWRRIKAPRFDRRKARFDDIPARRAILNMARHWAVLENGNIRDAWDSRERVVYSYWMPPLDERKTAERVAKIINAKVPRRPDPEAKVRRLARKLAKEAGVEIEKEDHGWYVYPPDETQPEDDPYDGDHYCESWDQILEMVKAYAKSS